MILAWPLLIALALTGWGLAAAAVARRAGGPDLRDAADVVPLGIATYLLVAGLALAVDRHTDTFTAGMVVLGVAFAVVVAARAVRAGWRPTGPRAATLVVGALLVGVLLAVALWRAAGFVWNACDDDLAYLYLVRRLTELGELLDPVNNRRLTSLGGSTSLQALFLGRLDDAALPLADLFLGSLLIMVQLWRSVRRRWSAVGVVAALLVTLYVGNLGIVNTSPVLVPTGLALATFRYAILLRAEAPGSSTPGGGRTRLVAGVVIGLLAGATTTLRPQFGALVVFVVVAVLLPPVGRASVERLAGTAVGGLAALAGWAVASWRAVGTPLFPLLRGNLDPSWPANGPDVPGPRLRDLAHTIAEALASPAYAIAFALGAIVVVLAVPPAGRHRRGAHPRLDEPGDDGLDGTRVLASWGARLYGVAIGTTLLLMVVLGTTWWGVGPLKSYPRFWAPFGTATVLLPITILDRLTGPSDPRRALRLIALASVATITLTGAGARPDLSDMVSDTLSGRSIDAMGVDRHGALRPSYDAATSLMAPGSKVLTTVDVPSLLLGADLEIHTLDLLGSTSPTPHLPFFRGPAAKLAWVRSQGYDYIVAVEPTLSSCLYNVDVQEENVRRGGLPGSWAPYDLDWFEFLAEVEAGAPGAEARATRVGALIVVEV